MTPTKQFVEEARAKLAFYDEPANAYTDSSDEQSADMECEIIRKLFPEALSRLEATERELEELRAVKKAAETYRKWIADDKDKDWTSCPDPNCPYCLAAKADLLKQLDNILAGRGPKI